MTRRLADSAVQSSLGHSSSASRSRLTEPLSTRNASKARTRSRRHSGVLTSTSSRRSSIGPSSDNSSRPSGGTASSARTPTRLCASRRWIRVPARQRCLAHSARGCRATSSPRLDRRHSRRPPAPRSNAGVGANARSPVREARTRRGRPFPLRTKTSAPRDVRGQRRTRARDQRSSQVARHSGTST